MAETVNALVISDNENGTQNATWTPTEQINPEQKVLLGRVNPLSGAMEASWAPSSGAAIFKEKTITENGVYDPQQEGADGYSIVTVNIPSADMVKLGGIEEDADTYVTGSVMHMYNDGEDRTIISGTLIFHELTTKSLVFTYPETFVPEKTVFTGMKGMTVIENDEGHSYYPMVNDEVVIDTTAKTLTITPLASRPFSYTTHIQCWAIL